MTTILTIVHIIVCFFLVVIVLLQQGKGASMGATFGGSSQTVFGTDGPLPLLNKVTTAAAVIFMVTSISLAYISAHTSTSSLMQGVKVEKPQGSSLERAVEPLPETDMTLVPAAEDVPMAPDTSATSEQAPDQELIPAVEENVEQAVQEATEAVGSVVDEAKETVEKAVEAVTPQAEEKAVH